MFYNFNNEVSVSLYAIVLAFEFLNDDLVDVDNILDALSEVSRVLSPYPY